MFRYFVRFTLVGALLLQFGCSYNRKITVKEPYRMPRQLSLDDKVQVTLKGETSLITFYQWPRRSIGETVRRISTDKLFGRVVAWEKEGIFIRIDAVESGVNLYRHNWISKVPFKDIEKLINVEPILQQSQVDDMEDHMVGCLGDMMDGIAEILLKSLLEWLTGSEIEWEKNT